MSQREFAKKLKRSNHFLWRIDAGERQVNVLEFFEIAKSAGLVPDELTHRVMRGSYPECHRRRSGCVCLSSANSGRSSYALRFKESGHSPYLGSTPQVNEDARRK